MILLGLFIEGLLSFLSPCVLPMIPLYMSYLATNKNNNKLEVFLKSLFFVLGLSLIFIILALAVDTIKPFLDKYSNLIGFISGILIIILGLKEMDILKLNLAFNHHVMDFDTSNMNYFNAFLLGFVFSLVISPCIGPILSSAILIGANSSFGFLYIMVYACGLLIPFFITGLFTNGVINYLKSKRNILKYVSIIAGIILIIYGLISIIDSTKKIISLVNNKQNDNNNEVLYLPDIDLYDQNGNTIDFDEYDDQYIMLNFIATWCHYCIEEIDDYQQFAKENADVKCFYVMSENSSGTSEDKIFEFILEQNIDLQVIIDSNDYLFNMLHPSGFPTLFIVNKNKEILGYVSGAYDAEGFKEILEGLKDKYE